ncbi:MAG: 6-bladed beta-propeller [Desulfococcaceae bacterium]
MNRLQKSTHCLPLMFFFFCLFFAGPDDAFTQEEYIFERMWPERQQPWFFYQPFDIASDNEGNVYVADSGNSRIHKLSANGEFLTSWGGFWSWWDTPETDGDGKFDWPSGIACDADGNIYITDSYNHRVQKFDANGKFVSKWGKKGIGNGEFDWPAGISADKSGHLYVFDTKNYRIQKFDLQGNFILAWGKEGSENSEFKEPPDLDPNEGKFAGIAVGTDGNIYAADRGNHRIQKFSPDGVYLHQWGQKGSVDGQFDQPSGIDTDSSGNVYVTDSYQHRIQVFSQDGNYIRQWGKLGYEYGNFRLPEGIAADFQGNIYVADTHSSRIQKFSGDYSFVTSWGTQSAKEGEFAQPHGLAADAQGNLYAVDRGNGRVQKFGATGNYISQFGMPGHEDGQLWEASGIAKDFSGNFYIADTNNFRIQKFDPNGNFLIKWGSKGTGDSQFTWPLAIAVSSDSHVYVSDYENHNIQKFDSNGAFVLQWGGYGTEEGKFNHPIGLAVDSLGYVYAADAANHRVQKFDPNGQFIRKWGHEGTEPEEFLWPEGISIDAENHVYVADKRNNRIQKFTSDGVYVTLFGEAGIDAGKLSGPSYLCVHGLGEEQKIYVSDTHNNRIQIFKPADPANPVKKSKAIIVAGGGPYPGNNLWNATQMCANFAYRALLYQGYDKDTVYYLSHDTDLDLDGNKVLDDVDADATNANLESAIRTWAADAQDLFVYMVDHGGNGTFRMREFQILKASNLDSWLDNLQAVIPGKVVMLYDACRSGSFLSQITPPTGKERVVAASSGPDQASVFAAGGTVSFSFVFWGHMFNGENFYTSYVRASQAMALSWSQTALIDANGNGTENETGDLNLAQTVKIGTETLFAGDMPSIQSVSPPQSLEGETTALLYAENVIDADGISHVWAVITPPDYSSGSSENPVSDLPVCDLLPVSDSRYEALCKGFTAMGTYSIAIYARDGLSVMGLPVQTEVIQAKGTVKGDIDGTDSLTSLADAVIALKVLAGADTSGLIRSDYAASKVDVNGDNAVGMEEAVYILRKVAGL